MPGLWDTAEMLIALAGDAEAATAAAYGMAEDCRKHRRLREAAFWREVAVAVNWVGNPQPLIAPRLPPAPPGRGAKVVRGRFAARLPRQRKRMLRLSRDLRGIFDRHAPKRPKKPETPDRED